MTAESFQEQLARLQQMADDNNSWDLSRHDEAAIRAVLVSHATLLATLQAVWRLAEMLDIGNDERAAIRHLVAPVLEDVDADPGPPAADTGTGLWPHLVAEALDKDDDR